MNNSQKYTLAAKQWTNDADQSAECNGSIILVRRLYHQVMHP
jgi:hypothetical protein